ncbi:unnamed protein product [Gulo gulo]|uniref:Uncharacterized protein n=1 Tax=Gulo gulo TaxID=48420 RepID=A0A9X9MBD3_GULGU|nr:unnamed protein product [Gulo gulo]
MLDSLLLRRSLFFTPYPFILALLRCLSEVPVVRLNIETGPVALLLTAICYRIRPKLLHMQGFLSPGLTQFPQHERAVPARAIFWALNSFCLLISEPDSGYFPHLEVPPHLLKSYICLRAR